MCLTRGRLTEERALSRRQLMLVHSPLLRWLARPLLPKGWTAGSFNTSGEVDAQRVALQTLGTRLAVLSIISFLCKSASAATSYFTRDDTNDPELQSILFLLTTLAVQAVPSAVTLLLLWRYFLGRGSDGSASLMQSLLTHGGESPDDQPHSKAAAARQGKNATEVAELHNQIAELRAKAEQASLLQEENAQLKAKSQEEIAQLRALTVKSQEAIAQLRTLTVKSQEENAQLRAKAQEEIAQLRALTVKAQEENTQLRALLAKSQQPT
jgi:hypothetical protein